MGGVAYSQFLTFFQGLKSFPLQTQAAYERLQGRGRGRGRSRGRGAEGRGKGRGGRGNKGSLSKPVRGKKEISADIPATTTDAQHNTKPPSKNKGGRPKKNTEAAKAKAVAKAKPARPARPEPTAKANCKVKRARSRSSIGSEVLKTPVKAATRDQRDKAPAPGAPLSPMPRRARFLTSTLRKAHRKRVEVARESMQQLRSRKNPLPQMTLPKGRFNRQSFTCHSTEEGHSSIQVILSSRSFYVCNAHVPEGLERFVHVDAKGGASIGWATYFGMPIACLHLELCIVVFRVPCAYMCTCVRLWNNMYIIFMFFSKKKSRGGMCRVLWPVGWVLQRPRGANMLYV